MQELTLIDGEGPRIDCSGRPSSVSSGELVQLRIDCDAPVGAFGGESGNVIEHLVPLGSSPVLFDPASRMYPAYGPSKSGRDDIEAGERFLVLPGHGISKAHCGEVRYGVRCSDPNCEDHKHLHLHHDHCDKITCPVCHTKAEERAASRIRDRMDGMKAAYEKEGVHFSYLDHVELSPDQSMFTLAELNTLEGYRKAFVWAESEIRRFVRNPAGTLMMHPWRFKHLDGSTCEDENCHEVHVPVFSLHFHWCGYGFWEKSSVVYEKTGAVYKKIQPGKKRDLFATVAYELSHCGVLMEAKEVHDGVSKVDVAGTVEYVQLSQSYRYLGLFSNSRGGFDVESKSHEVKLCDKCQHEVHEYDLDLVNGEYVPCGDLGPHMITVITGRWYINHRTKQTVLGGGHHSSSS